MKRRGIIFVSCCFLFSGICLASVLTNFFVSLDIFLFFSAVACFAAAVLFLGNRRVFIVCLWVAFLCLGAWRYVISLPIDSTNVIWHYNGQKVALTAIVAAEPINKPKSQSLILSSSAIKVSSSRNGVNGILAVKGRVAVAANRWPEYSYGQRLSVECDLEPPGVIEDFDYGTYLAVQGIYSTCSRPRISILGDDRHWTTFFWRPIVFARRVFRDSVDRGLDEPEAGLFKAFILGDKAVISDELSDKFRKSGLSHIVAISGTHITLLSGMVFFLFLAIGLSRRQAFYAVLPMLLFYVLLAGAPPSAVRSGFMGFLVLLAFHIGRLSRLDHSLIVSGAAMLMINPKLLVFDIGFQLSFAAVLGMIYIYPIIDRFFERYYRERHRLIKFLSQTLALTLAAQAITTPILFWHFRQISLVAPLANLFAVWIAPFIMGFGLAASAISILWPSLSQAWFLPAGICIKYLIFVAKFFSGFLWAYWKI